jgi:hypothetical protein
MSEYISDINIGQLNEIDGALGGE